MLCCWSTAGAADPATDPRGVSRNAERFRCLAVLHGHISVLDSDDEYVVRYADALTDECVLIVNDEWLPGRYSDRIAAKAHAEALAEGVTR